MIDGTIRKNIQIGMLVDIVLKKDQPTGKLTRGYVKRILTNSPQHHRGIKVELTHGHTPGGKPEGFVGRVQHIPTKEDIRLENFKFYNQFFFLPKIFSIWDSQNQQYLVIDHLNLKGVIEKTSFLFDSKEKAESFTKGTRYDHKDYSIREINRKKSVADNFVKNQAEFVRINKDRKLSMKKCQEWESYFKNMR